jgi:phospholipase/carboxylesterase
MLMNNRELSLLHLVRTPTVKNSFSCKPPLLLMLHSIFSNEMALMNFSQEIDPRFFLVSARAPITLKDGFYSWFPMKIKRAENSFLLEDLEKCSYMIIKFIDELVKAYDLERKQVYIMGFSQGAVIGYSLALTNPKTISGVVGMSGRIGSVILQEMHSQNLVDTRGLADLPVFASHGINDQIIPINYGRSTRDHLDALKVDLTYNEYLIDHSLDTVVIKDANSWLSSRLNKVQLLEFVNSKNNIF